MASNREKIMKLTIVRKLKLCVEILFARGKCGCPAHEKQLSIFKRGYDAGAKDKELQASWLDS